MPGALRTPYITCPSQRPQPPPSLPFALYECTRAEWVQAIRDGKITYKTNAFFLVKDTQEFYRGMTRYGIGRSDGGLNIVSGLPPSTSAVKGMLYFNSKDNQFYVFNGSEYVSCLPIDTSAAGAINKLSTDLRVPSSKNVYRFVACNIKALYGKMLQKNKDLTNRLADIEGKVTYLYNDANILAKLATLDRFRQIATARLVTLTQEMKTVTATTMDLTTRMGATEARIQQMQADITVLQEALRDEKGFRQELNDKLDTLDHKVDKLTAIDPSEDNLLKRTDKGLMAVQYWREVTVHDTEEPPQQP